MEDTGSRKICVEELKYKLSRDSEMLLSIGMERTSGKKHQYRVEAKGYPLKRNLGVSGIRELRCGFMGFRMKWWRITKMLNLFRIST